MKSAAYKILQLHVSIIFRADSSHKFLCYLKLCLFFRLEDSRPNLLKKCQWLMCRGKDYGDIGNRLRRSPKGIFSVVTKYNLFSYIFVIKNHVLEEKTEVEQLFN